MLNIICVNHNNYLGRGDDYVRRLARGVSKHLSQNFAFHVIAENDIPNGIEGWWAKIAVFQPGRFTGRCLFFDLDTVITGNIDFLAEYDGEFAGISDFYHPQLCQSAIMAWDADKAGDIWTRWHSIGMPQHHIRGDQGWIEAMRPSAERLQDLYPGKIVSFKAHCLDGVPEGASVVCFHGIPRPHHLADLMEHWK
jgi:hypothetical protein